MDELVPPREADIAYETDTPVRYETNGPVAWIVMDRPKYNNAQNSQMTYALDDAFRRAVEIDDEDLHQVDEPTSAPAGARAARASR